MAESQIGFFVDTTRCINCKTCEIACKEAAGAVVGQRIRRVRTFEGGEFPQVFAYNISMSCNHCEDPACVKGCPAGAYTKRPEDGIVVHDPDRCIGCRYCTWVCPWGAPQYDPRAGRVRKCNFCLDVPENAANGDSPLPVDPACVSACPMRAIEAGWLSEIKARAEATIDIRNLPSPEATRPACRFKVRVEARRNQEASP